MGIILTYAIDDRETFTNIENWMKQIKMHANENVIKVLVGNKCDMPDRQVTFEEGKGLADAYGIPFFETSAKDNRNINETFMCMAREIKDKILVLEQNTSPNVTSRLEAGDTKKEKDVKGCC